jgi:WD40 repeat protein
MAGIEVVAVLTDEDEDGYNDILSFAINSDGTILVTASRSGNVKTWDIRTDQLLGSAPCHDDYVHDPDNVDDWEYNEWDSSQRMEIERGFITSIVFHPTNPLIMATGSDDRTARLWELTLIKGWRKDEEEEEGGGEEEGEWEEDFIVPMQMANLGHSEEMSSIAFNSTGTILATCTTRGGVKLWDTSSYECVRTLVEEDDGVYTHLAYDPTGTFLAIGGCASSLKTQTAMAWKALGVTTAVGLWDATSYEPVATLDLAIDADISCLAFNSTGTLIAVGIQHNWDVPSVCKLLDTRSHACVATLARHEGGSSDRDNICSVAFHPTAPVIAIRYRSSVKLWDTKSGTCMVTLGGPLWHVSSSDHHKIAFDPTGTILAASRGPSVYLWDCSILSSKKQYEMALMREMQPTLAERMTMTTNMPWMAPRMAQEIVDRVNRKRGPGFFPQESSAILASTTAKASKALAASKASKASKASNASKASKGGAMTRRHRKRRSAPIKHAKTKRHRKFR